MATQSSGRNGRRSRGGRSRRRDDDRPYRPKSTTTAKSPAKQSLWDKIVSFFTGGGAKTSPRRPAPAAARNGASTATAPSAAPARTRDRENAPSSRKPEQVEVTSPRLYVGNLSFEATESDLFELFNGVGQVQNAEVVTYKHNQRSKGFAFVQMNTVDEAKRAVTELHDKEFLGRKLLVSGAKSTEHETVS